MSAAKPKTIGQAVTDGDVKFKPWLKRFSPEIFEVDFSDVIKGRGPSIYLDPVEFYGNTQMTQRMKDVLQWCLARTAGLNNKGTIYLATGFGGGKSHLLVLLYHTFKSKRVIDPHFLAEISLPDVPDVKVLAIDGHNLSFPMSSDEELGVYLKETKEETLKVLEAEGRPIVILVDELVVYLAKQSDEDQRKEIANLHTLISAVNSTSNCVIVVTNPKGSSVYGKEVETLDSILKKTREEGTATDVSSLLGRVTQPVVPIEKDDFVSILRKRLIDHINDKIADGVEAYLGRRLKMNFKGFYPFHPLLIDVLYERISLFPDFQKTRDVLKVIALAIKGLMLNKESANFYVISPADMFFEDADLRGILTNEKVFGSNLEQAVTQDVIKASLEADNGKKYGKFGRLASTVFMYSLHTEVSKRGVTASETLKCLTDAQAEKDVEEMLYRFYNEDSTFMWLEEGKFLFKSKQNVPNMIKIRSQQIHASITEAYIRKTLYQTVFEKASDSNCTFYRPIDYVPTPNRLNVMVPLFWDKIQDITSNFLSINAKIKNTNIVLVPDSSHAGALEYYSKLTLAAEKVRKIVKEDKALFTETKKLGQEYEAHALQQFKGMYTKAKFLQGTAIKEVSIDPMKGTTIRDALLRRLKDAQKVIDIENVNPKDYLEALLGTRKAVQVRNLFSDVETMTTIPFASRKDLKVVIGKGVYEGSVGLLKGMLPADGKLTGREQVILRKETTVNDGDTLTSIDYAQKLSRQLEEMRKRGPEKEEEEVEEKEEEYEEGPTEEEETDTFVADAGDLYQVLNEKWSEILLKDIEARAIVDFSGTIKGTLAAKNRDEISAIIDLADGLKKASRILGGVKATVTIYKKTVGDKQVGNT